MNTRIIHSFKVLCIGSFLFVSACGASGEAGGGDAAPPQDGHQQTDTGPDSGGGGAGGGTQDGGAQDSGPSRGEILAHASVGPAGATLSGQGITVTIPADALYQQTVSVAITKLSPESVAALPAPVPPGATGPATPAGDAFEITPHGTEFDTNVEIAIAYSGNANVLMRLDSPDDTTWEIVSGATFDQGTVRVPSLRHFSIFRAFAFDAAANDCGCVTDLECAQPDPMPCVNSMTAVFIGTVGCYSCRCQAPFGYVQCAEGLTCVGYRCQ